jgi:hypothetical protein
MGLLRVAGNGRGDRLNHAVYNPYIGNLIGLRQRIEDSDLFE